MEEKKFYSPEEVAEIARNYHSVGKVEGHNLPMESQIRKRYEEIVPKNVREIIDKLNDLELIAFKKSFD